MATSSGRDSGNRCNLKATIEPAYYILQGRIGERYTAWRMATTRTWCHRLKKLGLCDPAIWTQRLEIIARDVNGRSARNLIAYWYRVLERQANKLADEVERPPLPAQESDLVLDLAESMAI